MTIAKYNFDKNLIKASYKKDLYGAKREWQIIGKDIREEQNGLCICQRKVKYIIYMYNPKTKLTIMVGSKCAKKFELNNFSLSNNILRELLKNNLLKGDYEIIDNIIRYSYSIEEQFIKYFENKIDKCNNNQNKLLEIKNEIKELINIYSLMYLNNIYETLNTKIIKINIHKELIDKCLVYSVKTFTHNYVPCQGSDIYENTKLFRDIDECNNYILSLKPLEEKITKGYGYTLSENTLKKIEIIYKNDIIKTLGKLFDDNKLPKTTQNINPLQLQMQLQIKESIDEVVPIILHTCSLDICKCENPDYELIKINNNYYCNNCSKWRCRCNQSL
jgi:hypothetical protein